MRVCADPNNLPFSNARGEGFENALAELVARDLGRRLVHVWWAQRRGFIRNTLNAGLCDVVMGTPKLDMLDATEPYYRSAYVFVSRADRELDISSIKDPRLRELRIGVHLIGDDGSNVPPAHALSQQGIVTNLVGYSIYGDYRESDPPARLIEAVAAGEVDIAAAWGPLAGYFAKRSAVELRVTPMIDTISFIPLVFEYPIAMGVRRGDPLKDELNGVIRRRGAEIKALLESYGVPVMEPRRPRPPARRSAPALVSPR
ncbi:MAG TPA: substrate-binding domain-containing protein [Afifellaceae bacterium]|nr:substrate-binding domain-containing protein [Afifellaceae bacterium]